MNASLTSEKRVDPTFQEAAFIADLHRAYEAMKKIGWRDAMYCARDNHLVHVFELGSIGIHVAHRDDVCFWVHDIGFGGMADLYPSHPILYREIPK